MECWGTAPAGWMCNQLHLSTVERGNSIRSVFGIGDSGLVVTWYWIATKSYTIAHHYCTVSAVVKGLSVLKIFQLMNLLLD